MKQDILFLIMMLIIFAGGLFYGYMIYRECRNHDFSVIYCITRK